ncbi:MAG: magnesium chelatase family protein [Pseudonocardiales bacterium]|jgi:magnesium chelatase family protein|nr:magnesium chelatase family protein [Pseudonocardiales bacterium]
MPLGRAFAVALTGLDGQLVEVECDISSGLPGLSFTGLPDASVNESRDRLKAALNNSAAPWPQGKLTVALLPADVRKVGSRFDLAVGMAVLAADGQVPAGAVADAVWIAELGLDGRLRPVRGVLPSVLAARRSGAARVVVSAANGAEAALVPDIDVRSAERLADVVAWLNGDGPPLDPVTRDADEPPEPAGGDLSDVVGQGTAKRALEITAAGGHHLYLLGAPGAGKTMLAERLPGLLPELTDRASIEVTAIHSVAGLLGERARLVRRPPLQAPHHTASVAALVGGGSHLARPGAISLAHHGVLFLDEAAEFAPRALDALRQPLESGAVALHRSGGTVRYPARFQLVLAANPCPCGKRPAQCVCESLAKRRHEHRLSGPLMDRIDLKVIVEPVAHADLVDALGERETSAAVAARVAAARASAAERWRGTPWEVNSAVPGSVLRTSRWLLPRAALRPAERFFEQGSLSARGFDRVLRLSWTIADLAGNAVPDDGAVEEALFFRTGGAGTWAA